MPRNTCPGCRAENLSTALVCVTCSADMPPARGDGSSADAAGASDEAWIPPMPVRPVSPRATASNASLFRRRAIAPASDEAIPQRPDVER
jgi:hypothetical protein